jgi:hypothetical protein
MFKVHFINFFYIKEFNSLDEALSYAKSSGFECVVFDNRGRRVQAFGAY